jgi:hypothetical protein
MSRLWEETMHMLLLGRVGKNVATILNIKWKRTPLRVLLQGNCTHVIILAKSLQAAAHKPNHPVKPHT